MYVPYNSYKAHSDQTKVDDLIKPHFINPDLLRYELHRVWVVEANLKPGQRHINPKRTFYLERRQLADPRDRSLRHRWQTVALFRSAERELLRSAGVLVDVGMPLRPEILALSGAGSGQSGTGIRLLVPATTDMFSRRRCASAAWSKLKRPVVRRQPLSSG